MRGLIFGALIVLGFIACEKKVESKDEVQKENAETSGIVYHVTCFSGGQVVYEGDLKYFTGEGWDYMDMKTKIKFRIRDQNDCYWSSASFYKTNQ